MAGLDSKVKKVPLFKKCFSFKRAENLIQAGLFPYFREIQESEGPVVQIEGKKVIMAGSNNYLGLTTHPKVREAAIQAINKYGTSCSGSRFLTGTIDLHNQLEEELSGFLGKEAALVFSTGFQAGQGVISTLVGRGEYILADKDNHASLVAGHLISKSTGSHIIRYNHLNNDHLETHLRQLPADAGKLIISDGVFSTYGEIINLPEIIQLAKKYNAQVLVDDAHALGVIGESGRGTGHYFHQSHDVDLILCTFSKTLASIGGFVAGDKVVIDFIKHQSPAFIFSASPSPPNVAAALAALNILRNEPQRIQQLRFNADYVRKGLQELGFEVLNGETAIVPVIVPNEETAFKMWKILYEEENIFVNVFVPPAAPAGKAMLRNSFMATHATHHLNRVLEGYKKAGKKLNII